MPSAILEVSQRTLLEKESILGLFSLALPFLHDRLFQISSGQKPCT